MDDSTDRHVDPDDLIASEWRTRDTDGWFGAVDRAVMAVIRLLVSGRHAE